MDGDACCEDVPVWCPVYNPIATGRSIRTWWGRGNERWCWCGRPAHLHCCGCGRLGRTVRAGRPHPRQLRPHPRDSRQRHRLCWGAPA